MTIVVERHHVKIGELKVVADEGVLYTIGLGSCVAVVLYDPGKKIGGLAHVMLPAESARAHPAAGRFAPLAVPNLIEEMVKHGARTRGTFARIAGGAAMFKDVLPAYGLHLGERNIAAVKEALAAASIPLRNEDTGGTFGRSVYFDVADGSVVIRVVRRDDIVL